MASSFLMMNEWNRDSNGMRLAAHFVSPLSLCVGCLLHRPFARAFLAWAFLFLPWMQCRRSAGLWTGEFPKGIA